jgi:hypothetical protein
VDKRLQRLLYHKANLFPPTVKTELVLLTAIIDAAKKQKVAMYNISGLFLHSRLLDIVHLRVVGDLAKRLVNVKPDLYFRYVIIENGKEVIYLLLT